MQDENYFLFKFKILIPTAFSLIKTFNHQNIGQDLKYMLVYNLKRSIERERETKLMAPLNRSPSSSKPRILQHFTDPKHPLHLLHIPKEFLCNGCTALGFGTRYRCDTCDVDLHEICATCPTATPSPLHPKHPLILVNQPVNDRSCDLCGDLVHGLFYTCRACDFDVHPLCTQLPLHVKLPLHPQHLLKLQPASPAACALCYKACTSWRYRCDTCSLDIHLECVLGGSPDQVGFGGCAVGIPIGGGGYGMPSPAMMMMSPPTKVEGQTSSGRRRRKIYSIVGRLAATAVITSIIGIPLGF
ncbi:hypothetical protein Pfo_027456 [Paulownia fortunei]|nr:hypothetical protein Pfo_027456 [Paulownia fortunei]